MDQRITQKKIKINPKETANVLSVLSFLYTYDLFKTGYKKDLGDDDLYEVLTSCKSKNLGDQLENQWEIEKKNHKNPSIVRVLWACFGKTYMLYGVMQLVMRTIMVLFIPEALGKLVSYFSYGQKDLTLQDASFYAATVIGLNMINFIYTQNYMMLLTEYGIRVRTALCSCLYRKALRMTETSLSEITMGKIVTLITKDIFAVEMVILFGNDIWIGLIQTGIVCYLIYAKIGVAAFAGVGFFLLVLPLQVLIGRMATVLRLKTSKKTDERLQLTQEILSAIKTIKMYAWESFFDRKISTSRKNEVNAIFKLFYLKIIIIVIGGLSSKIAFYLLIMTFVWLGNNITAEIVYFIMACFGKLRHLLSMLLPLGITFGAEFNATLIRLGSVMEAEEISTPRSQTDIISDPAIILNKVTVKIRGADVFRNVSIDIRKGLTVIVGHVGSGKTTFLKTILEECKIEGTLTIYGKISYASQEPWLFPSTIKHNILFGEDFHQQRYSEVLKICALNKDFKSFGDGDETIVGDNGINLSKGQQARVSLARAIYKNADIYLLDDCLAALDGHVSDYVFRECIQKFLKDKICVLVTNNCSHIERADEIIEINQGSIKYNETPKIPQTEESKEEADPLDDMEKLPLKEAQSERIYNESKKSGKVELNTYKRYVTLGGGYFVFSMILVLFVIVQTAVSYSDKLVSNWVTIEQNLSTLKTQNLTNSSEYVEIAETRTSLLTLYTIIIVSSTVLSLLKTLSFFAFNRKASINLHKVMVSKIINAKMFFFDTTFIGTVLNRFVKDLCTIDEHLPFTMNECFELCFIFFGVVFLVASVNALFLIPATIFFIITFIVRHVYLRTGRSLQRLEASTRSPLLGHLNASLEGLTTIRAFRAQEIIMHEFDRHQDLYTSANYTLHNSTRALAFILDMMCSIFISLVIVRFLVMPMDTSVGNVGLAISQSFHLTGLLQYGIRKWADFENQMTSVERVLEFDEIEQEDKNGKIVKAWPEKGKISYENVSMNYSDNRQVLKNVSFTIKPKQKVGIVGRTGAGKSSIVSTLFRLYDIKGTIKIDDVNIQDLAINCLRSNITIIPQDPVLISGTIRENIDPLKKCRDEEIWKLIKVTNLHDLVTSLSDKVDSNTNFSAGQKQLICLARAIARKNKIVVLDEATANLDHETDALIRDVIEQHFSSCTVIVIAHRLASVLASDVVMVVDEGRIVEQDEPAKLLEDKKSLFFEMINQT